MKNKFYNLPKSIVLILLTVIVSITIVSCMKPGDMTIQSGAQCFKQQKFEEAESYFKQALNEECSYSKDMIYIYISNCYSQRGDYETAISYRKQAIELKKSASANDYNNIAILYRYNKDDVTAEQYYLKAIEVAPEDAIAYVSLGGLYMTAENFDKAIIYLEKSELLNTKIPITHADLAICYAKKGDFIKAEEQYKKAEKLKADNLEQFRAQLDEIEKNAKAN